MLMNDNDALVHILLNPKGWSEEVRCDAMKRAAKELQRLFRFESEARSMAREIATLRERT